MKNVAVFLENLKQQLSSFVAYTEHLLSSISAGGKNQRLKKLKVRDLFLKFWLIVNEGVKRLSKVHLKTN